MATQQRLSPLFDPLLLESSTAAANKVPEFWNNLKKMNWKQLALNVVLPLAFFLFIAFNLRSRYDRKREIKEEYFAI